MKTALLIMILVPVRPQARWDESPHVNCETVRAYVGQVGLAQVTALARAAGMTAGQEWRARRSFAKKV